MGLHVPPLPRCSGEESPRWHHPLSGCSPRPCRGSGPHRPPPPQQQRRAAPHAALWQFVPRRSARRPSARSFSSSKNIARINIRGCTTRKTQSRLTTPKFKPTKKELFLINLQIGTSVRCSEDPSPGSPSRCRHFCSPRSCLLDVRGRWVLGNATTVAWGDIGAAVWPTDQGWGRLLLLIVLDDPNKPSALGCLDVRS